MRSIAAIAALLCICAASTLADNLYQVNILRLDHRQPAICSGALVSENIVLTSAQCVRNAQPDAIHVLPVGGRNSHNVSRIHWDALANATTLFPDVVLLQLANGTRLPTLMRPVSIDWTAQQSTDCTVQFAHNRTDVAGSLLRLADVHLPCERYGGRNLTTCTNYTFSDYSQCLSHFAEVTIDHGTPLICRGHLTGIVSNVVKRPVYTSELCSLNATAYFSRFDARTSEWIKRTLNANRPVAATAGPTDVYVTHWPTGTIARPTAVLANAAPAAGFPDAHQHQQHQQQHPSNQAPANGKNSHKRNDAGKTSGSAFGVLFSLAVFAVLTA